MPINDDVFFSPETLTQQKTEYHIRALEFASVPMGQAAGTMIMRCGPMS